MHTVFLYLMIILFESICVPPFFSLQTEQTSSTSKDCFTGSSADILYSKGLSVHSVTQHMYCIVHTLYSSCRRSKNLFQHREYNCYCMEYAKQVNFLVKSPSKKNSFIHQLFQGLQYKYHRSNGETFGACRIDRKPVQTIPCCSLLVAKVTGEQNLNY